MKNKIIMLMSVVFLLSGCSLINDNKDKEEINENPVAVEESVGVELKSFDDIESYRAIVENTDLEGNE